MEKPMLFRLAANLTFAGLVTLLAVLLPAQSLQAQSSLLPGTGNPPETEQGLLDEIVSQAEQRGASVIVINPGGEARLSNDRSAGSASKPDMAVLMDFQNRALRFRQTLKQRLKSLPESIPAVVESLRGKSPSGTLQPYLKVLYWSVLLLAIGAFVERQVFMRWVIRRWLVSRVETDPQGYTDKLPLLIARALLGVLGVFISMGVAYTIGSLLFRGTPPEPIQFSISLVYLAYAASRIVAIIWQVILAPYLHQYRIPQLSNAEALKLFHWLWISAAINIAAMMMFAWVAELGANKNANAVFASAVGLLAALTSSALVLANRQAISRAMRGGKTTQQSGTALRLFSTVWVPFSIVYFFFSWIELTYRATLDEELGVPLIAGAYAVLSLMLVAYGVFNYLIDRGFRRKRTIARINAELAQADAIAEPDANSTRDTQVTAEELELVQSAPDKHVISTYEDLARRVAGIFSLVAGFWALKKLWLVDQIVVYSDLAKRSYDLIAILFIGYVVYHIVRIWIDNKIREEGGDMPALTPGDEGGASSASRLATLLPLFRNFMLVVVAVSVAFSALLELGINISPLFAGAGVVGLAIGFGAQTLVRDIFSGAFYLFDDAFRKGEYVDIGDVKGTVENISVRSFQLRHHLGPLHTIPFGEIRFLTNYSRDWVMMKLPLRLTYDTDPERVRKLIKKLGLALMEDPEIGDTFLQPLKSQGVIEMQDSAMIVRVKFMAKPGDQWVIRKRVFQEIRDLFAREGIKFAHREVTVRLAGENATELTAEQKKTVAAAALNDEEEADDAGGGGDDR